MIQKSIHEALNLNWTESVLVIKFHCYGNLILITHIFQKPISEGEQTIYRVVRTDDGSLRAIPTDADNPEIITLTAGDNELQTTQNSREGHSSRSPCNQEGREEVVKKPGAGDEDDIAMEMNQLLQEGNIILVSDHENTDDGETSEKVTELSLQADDGRDSNTVAGESSAMSSSNEIVGTLQFVRNDDKKSEKHGLEKDALLERGLQIPAKICTINGHSSLADNGTARKPSQVRILTLPGIFVSEDGITNIITTSSSNNPPSGGTNFGRLDLSNGLMGSTNNGMTVSITGADLDINMGNFLSSDAGFPGNVLTANNLGTSEQFYNGIIVNSSPTNQILSNTAGGEYSSIVLNSQILPPVAQLVHQPSYPVINVLSDTNSAQGLVFPGITNNGQGNTEMQYVMIPPLTESLDGNTSA